MEYITLLAGFKSLADCHKKFTDEQVCRDPLEAIRWGGHIRCPYCDADRVSKFKDGKHYKCAVCRRKFTVKVGTIFEDSPLPLFKWFLVMYLLTAHKKGISSVQLAKDIEVTQKTAWFMLGRIRWAVRAKSFNAPLAGVVEADETYVGGKPRKKEEPRKRGRTTDKKTPVLAVIERGGELRALAVTIT